MKHLWLRLILGWLCLVPLVQAQGDQPDLSQQHREARQQQAALRARITALQESMAAQVAQQRDITQTLQASESAISALQRELANLRRQARQVQAELTQLEKTATQHAQTLAQRRQALAQQLRAQYTSGLSPWVALLSGTDPQVIGRDLGYLGYVSQAQSKAVREIQQTLAEQERLRTQSQEKRRALAQLESTTSTRMHALQAQQKKRQQTLQGIENQLLDQRTQVARLERDTQRLSRLVTLLETELAAAAAEPVDTTRGLNTKLPYPVQGRVQGTFGSERPDGGVWRGIVIRAPEGTQVRAVAAGTVVYAKWLAGFGNLMIVDHGAQYLSVYAYNQSLLHDVGDAVRAGQAIALVGATGGQVEPGLYFEIRHHGVPVNPLLWLRPTP